MINPSLFSSETGEWETPQWLFDEQNAIYHFTLDAAATKENAKVKCNYFTKEQNALVQDWAPHIVWLNPPYGRGVGEWIKKAYEECLKGACVVCLLPARTDTAYWHKYVIPFGYTRFIKGRLKFGGSTNSAPFPSALVTFMPPDNG